MKKIALFLLCCSIFLTGCSTKSYDLEPEVIYFPQEKMFKQIPSCFEPLSAEEAQKDWGKELKIATVFARELDLYRAITSYKRALVLIPGNEPSRRLEIEYDLLFAYYIAGKYQDAIDVFEASCLMTVPATFPAFRNLIIILYDAYQRTGEGAKACGILALAEQYDPDLARDLQLSTALREADFGWAEPLIEKHPQRESFESWRNCYCENAKSVQTAQWLNAILPGAGYYYVGQPRTALTSFLLNAAFIAATYQFIDHGYPAAAVITGSLEMGWYLGGINGAGLEAKTYNEVLYAEKTKETMIQHRLFPILMFQCAF